MLVERLLPIARERLVTIADDASLIQAAHLLRSGIDLVVVCDPAGSNYPGPCGWAVWLIPCRHGPQRA